jgi:hypothetical protein
MGPAIALKIMDVSIKIKDERVSPTTVPKTSDMSADTL